MPKLSDDELIAILEAEKASAIGYSSSNAGSELSTERAKAMSYYMGEPFGNEAEGRSSVISTDVADTIEGIMPSLMKIFASGDEVVRFEPQGPEDEKAAQQATDYVNYIFQRQNNGFVTLYTWFKDALLQKNGFVKVYYEKYDEVTKEAYAGLTQDELLFIAQDPEIEIIEHEQGVNELGEPIFNIRIQKTKNLGKICIDPVPPEEILVNKEAKLDLKKARYIRHNCKKTISDLKEAGYSNVDDLVSYDNDDFNIERQERFSDELNLPETESMDKAMRTVWVSEEYVMVDYDGDGKAEAKKITRVGKTILDVEDAEGVSFVTLTPIIMPHKLIGRSVAELIMDIQLIKSTVLRQILDNMYLANNGRYMALDGMVNLDDLLTSRPGGVVRVKAFDAVKRLDSPLLGAPAFNLMEYLDTIKENRTGVTRYNQGIDANSLNKTATGINIIQNASMQRIELIARVFAETGVKDLFYAIFELVLKHENKKQVVRLRNEWVPIDPREWKNKYDMTVAVGIGNGNKDQDAAHLMSLMQIQQQMFMAGLPTVTLQNLYNSAAEYAKAIGRKNAQAFFTDPQGQAMPQKPDPKIEEAKIKQDTELRKAQIKAQADLQKAHLDNQAQLAMQANTPTQDTSGNDALEKYKADLASQTQIIVTQMKGEIDLMLAGMKQQVEQYKVDNQKVPNGSGTGTDQGRESSSDS